MQKERYLFIDLLAVLLAFSILSFSFGFYVGIVVSDSHIRKVLENER